VRAALLWGCGENGIAINARIVAHARTRIINVGMPHVPGEA